MPDPYRVNGGWVFGAAVTGPCVLVLILLAEFGGMTTGRTIGAWVTSVAVFALFTWCVLCARPICPPKKGTK